MLRAMLDSHPDVAVPHESYFVVPALHRRAGFEGPDGVDRNRLLTDLGRDESFTRWGLATTAIDRVRADATLRSVPDTVRALYGEYARKAGKTRFADKTPRNVLHIGLLAAAFPDARFVHLVRDGRDVVPSMLGLDFFPDRFPEAALYWADRVERGRRAGRRLGPDRYVEVHYEELVADAPAVLAGLCDFLSLPFDPAMLRYHERADEVVAAVHDTGHHQGLWQPPTVGRRSWRESMSPRDVARFEALAGSALDDFGYERSGVPPSLRARAEASAWRLRRAATARAKAARAKAAGAWGSVSR
jgi:hypothetical protein